MPMSNIDNQDDARRTVEAVMRRDRRRVRWLAGVTIALWVVAFFVLPGLYLPACAKVKFVLAGLAHPPAGSPPLSAQELADKIGSVFGGTLLIGLVIMCAV